MKDKNDRKVKKKRKKKKISNKKTIQLKIHKPMLRPWLKRNKEVFLHGFWILGVSFLIFFVVWISLHLFTVTTVIVQGNVHYSVEEIQDMVMGERFGKNSIYLFLKYRNKQIEDIPFIESMSVSIVSPSTVKITVYEKSMAGYVEYMGQYFYFDQDGTIVESSDRGTEGIPQIIGLNFSHIILFEPLPVDDETIFLHILDISQLLNKYEISADKIYFDSEYRITLYFGDCRIKLGNTDYIDEKIMKLKMILPEIEGKKGVLQMENYSPDSLNVTFEMEN